MNQVTLIGRLGKTPELKTGNNTEYSYFSIAVTESWKDKEGNWQEKTDWIDVVAFKHLAKRVSNNFQKGDRVAITGKMRAKNAEKDGVKFSRVNVQADYVTAADLIKRDEAGQQVAQEPEMAASGQDDLGDLPF